MFIYVQLLSVLDKCLENQILTNFQAIYNLYGALEILSQFASEQISTVFIDISGGMGNNSIMSWNTLVWGDEQHGLPSP